MLKCIGPFICLVPLPAAPATTTWQAWWLTHLLHAKKVSALVALPTRVVRAVVLCNHCSDPWRTSMLICMAHVVPSLMLAPAGNRETGMSVSLQAAKMCVCVLLAVINQTGHLAMPLATILHSLSPSFSLSLSLSGSLALFISVSFKTLCSSRMECSNPGWRHRAWEATPR